ncbi:FAD synthase-like isoform X2 [Prorops nasuta]|uniref:FAD synthase-like isoform X2 n=1 Tax=Prorops nasuta TaxID=863751 RepID=UPI0034D01F57
MEKYTACLIVIGDEILRGQVIDLNTSYLAKNLRKAGIKLCKVTVIPDNVSDIADEIQKSFERFTNVFTSGGVGPTHDDVTYEAVAKAFDLKIEQNQELTGLYTRLLSGKPDIARLALAPSTSEIVYVQSNETYAVIKVKNVYVLPGSPKYFQPAVDTIIPKLEGSTPLCFEYIDVHQCELSIIEVLDEQAARWKNKVNIGSYPQQSQQPLTRITLEGSKEDVALARAEIMSSLKDSSVVFGLEQAKSIMLDEDKHVKQALDVLEECYDRFQAKEIFISFNGGKDGTVVLHLAATVAKLRNASSLICLYVTNDTFSEVDEFVEQAASYYGLTLVRKDGSIRSSVERLLEEKPNLKASLMGVRKGDPGSEKLSFFSITDPGWPSLTRVNPILNWSYNQVWKFLLKYNVPYCKLYDQGYTSIGTKSTTLPNPLLKDPNSPSYLPAYVLVDDSTERNGRE